jgi:predicted RNA binding protein YcfA (HicA-like mRNA interferase family)
MNERKLLSRLLRGATQNVRFSDAVRLIEAFGFHLSRINGSHHIFAHPEVDKVVNLQNVNGQAKAYQLHQFLRLVEKNNLRMRGET